jgi:hypothetical protein
MKAADFNPVKNVYQSLVTPEGEERQGKGTKEQAEAIVINREKGYDEKGGRIVRFRGDTRSNKAKENERMETTKWKEGIMEWTPTSKEEEKKAIGISTMAINGSPEVNQIETSNGDETESSNGNQMGEENDQEKTNSEGDKSSNNNKDETKSANSRTKRPGHVCIYSVMETRSKDRKGWKNYYKESNARDGTSDTINSIPPNQLSYITSTQRHQ